MKKTILTAAALALGISGFAGVSQAAQMYPGGNGPFGPPPGPHAEFSIQQGGSPFLNRHRILSNQEIRLSLRRQGYSDIHFVNRDRLRVVVRAEDRRNRDWILTVSATSGQVLNRQAVYHSRRGSNPGVFFGFQFGG